MTKKNYIKIGYSYIRDQYKELLLWPVSVFLFLFGLEVIILCCTNKKIPIYNIVLNILGSISLENSELPKWAYLYNTIVGILFNVFIIGLIFNMFVGILENRFRRRI